MRAIGALRLSNHARPLEFYRGIQKMTDRTRRERTRIALVTGANKGIGKEISRQLSTKDVHVLMGARNQQRGEKAAAELRAHGLPVEFLNMDVTSQTSVDGAASEVEARHGRLDVLVNNSAIAMDLLPGSELTMDVLQKTFETNVFGVFRVIKIHACPAQEIGARPNREYDERERLVYLLCQPAGPSARQKYVAGVFFVESCAQYDHLAVGQ